MRKRKAWRPLLAALVVTLVAVIGLTPKPALAEGSYVAKIGNTEYETLEAAVNAAESGQILILCEDVTESVIIPEGKTFTIDLDGHKITNNAGMDTLTVSGGADLAIIDTSEQKTGVVDNVSHGKAALVTQEGSTVVLNGGTFMRSEEAGTSSPNGNSYYTILNKGNLTINDGATVELLLADGSPAGYSSIIDNGWYSGAPTTDGYNATLTINGGTIRGGKYLKNDSYGTLVVKGGQIVDGANAGILNWNVATVNDGTIDPSDDATGCVYNIKQSAAEQGSVDITGGNFVTTGGQRPVFTAAAGENVSNDAVISGGTFSTVPEASYLADGVAPLKDGSSFSVVPEGEAKSAAVATVTTADGQVVYFVSAADAHDFAEGAGAGAEVHVTTYRVTFDPGYEGGTSFSRYVTKNSSVARPADPERAGYEFAGWVTEGGRAYRFGSAVTRSLTLTATWELAEPDVTVSVSDESPVAGDVVTITATVVEVEGVGYSYQWYVDGEPIEGATGSSIEVAADGSYSVRVTATDADGQVAELTTDPVELTFGGVAMHRLYNPHTGEHLYTSDVAERDALVGAGWSYEGVAWVAPAEGAPVWRLYNPHAPGGDHHYTTDENEYAELQRLGWRGEGVAWYSAGAEDEGAVALYRLYNPYATTGTHHYTADAIERDELVRLGWRHEGVAWYGLR